VQFGIKSGYNDIAFMIYLYLDESGDLGFDFVNKKPSKYFTILIVMVKTITDNKNLSLAVKKTLARKLNPRRSMTKPEILEFNKILTQKFS
jgi:hypothetical protein